MMKVTIFLIQALAIFLFFGCSSGSDAMTIKELETLINDGLSPGDSSQKIESFLDGQGFSFDYDRHRKRYQVGYPGGRKTKESGVKEAIVVRIYVNDDKSFKEVEVKKVYTYL